MRSLDPKDLQYRIRSELKRLGMWSLAAEYLLLGTAAQESHCGRWLEQMDNGPAVGIFQMEPATYFDVLSNVVPAFERKTGFGKSHFPDNPEFLKYDINLAIHIARLYYARFSEPLPFPKVSALGRYWKKYWNTEKGKGTVEEYVKNFPVIIV